ncbi:MAG: diaminopimelate epimerase [Rickettsiales bacterium]|jgi:diaminopimelate epimerase|nr:diaminopimelate epimerase [Rickettsiales bacterium]
MSKKEINFTKMQGLGNDFVVVRAEDIAGVENISDFVKKICDRRFGVGGDGVGVILAKPEGADAEFRIFNSDGSEAMMCGNGIRGAAIYARDNGIVGKDKKEIAFKTKSGIKVVSFVGGDVRVDMGEPIIYGDMVVNGKTGKNVSMGNPHFVIVYNKDIGDLDLECIGPKFENAPVFPDRTNTEFVKILDRKNIDMRVWERGAGETLACGTGACASAVAAATDDLTDREVRIHMRGGNLNIDWKKSDNRVYMTGPAETSFIGKFFFNRQKQ